MAINRDSYKSLVESVNEAVASTSTGSSTDPQGWVNGPYGSGNAQELANILAQMMYGGKSSPSSPAANLSTATKSTSSKGGKGGKRSLGTASRPISAKMVKEALDILAEAEGWGGGYNLARLLNAQMWNSPSLSTPSTPKKSSGSTNARAGRRIASTSNIGNRAYSGGASASNSKGSPAGTVAEDQDWDILDEILAEGLELYGEDGLAEILSDFAETGEMSQELADLLDGPDQLDEVSLKKK